MGRIRRRDYLASDLQAATELYESLPDDGPHRIDKIGLRSRIRSIEVEISSLADAPVRAAETVLYFYGEPVVSDRGIDARFSSEVLKAYQDLVSKQVASQIGPLRPSGPVKAAKETHLHITNIVHGSFGFELEEIPTGDLSPGVTPLAQAVDEVSYLIRAVKESDEAFADVVAGTDERVYDALRGFISTVHKAKAAFRMATIDGEIGFDRAAVEAANDRASAERSVTGDQPTTGTLLGILPDARRFEFRQLEGGEVIRGRIAKEVPTADLLDWINKVCIAHVRVVELKRGPKLQKAYTLLDVPGPTEIVETSQEK